MADRKCNQPQPLVSVILPVYNAGKFLSAALTSILFQTYQSFEVIAVDDGSTDNSYKLLHEFARNDPRIKVLRNKRNRGIGYTANRAIKVAKGEFIARMDADDIMLPDRLKRQVEYLLANPDTVLVGGQCLVIDESGQVTGQKTNPTSNKEIYKSMFNTMSVQNPTLMINTKLVSKKQLVLDNKFHPVDDLDLMFRLFSYGKLANLEDTVLKYRVYRGSATMKDPKRSFWLTLRVRLNAIAKYRYRPTLKAALVCTAQTIIVLLLPGSLVYALYGHLRGVRRVSISLPTIRPLAWATKWAAALLLFNHR